METSIIINGFRDVELASIVEAVEKAREGGLDDESASSPEVNEDLFNGCYFQLYYFIVLYFILCILVYMPSLLPSALARSGIESRIVARIVSKR